MRYLQGRCYYPGQPPAETHYKLAAAALKSGLDVLVEKPLTLSNEEALHLGALSEEFDRIFRQVEAEA